MVDTGLRTLWTRRGAAPLRAFVRTESASAVVLVAAVAVALIWANAAPASYDAVWDTRVALRIGASEFGQDLRGWVDGGLMTLFFLVVGLEARREFDLGDLRERRRFVLPLVAGVVGMAVPIGIFLLCNAGLPSAHGWGVAMSTDTALALGLLAILGPNVPDKVRLFVLTIFVVDDLAALIVIAVAYSDRIVATPLVLAVVVFALLLVVARSMRRRSVYFAIGLALWLTLEASGVDPVVAGLVIGLSAPAYTPSRDALEQATGRVREFREQPTPELVREATTSLTGTLSPNARLQSFYHPWTSFVIVPLFALANAGVVLSGDVLGQAFTSPVTLGVLVGYVVGKPVGVVFTAGAVTVLSRGRIRPPVGWVAVLGSGTIAGVGFTVALLIANRAFQGPELDQAKVGALTAVIVSAGLTWAVFRLTALLPPAAKARALIGDVAYIQDLVPEVDPDHDHVRGPMSARITVIEFGDFECPYCGQAEPAVRELLADVNVRYVWRHLPLTDVHPRAQYAAEAAEAAAAQGAFWEMHDLLLAHQDELRPVDVVRYAEELDLDMERFHGEMRQHVHETRVAQDVESADLSGVS
ncbi:MAG: Na+/H+ antiporter NhaA, partial [Pseudonocardia sp.]|nr:Na+/H+ antiporter NhaA [Pseudonocardia sp.]